VSAAEKDVGPQRQETELARLDSILAVEPQRIDVLIGKAYLLSGLGRREQALACMQRAVALAPRDPGALNTRGMVLEALGRHDEALADFEQALEIQPDHADAINNRGIYLARAGRFEDALACYERSLAIAPDQAQARYNRATALLALGHWLRGFREFEIRWRIFPIEAGRRNRLKPVWLGERDVSGKTILLHHEQGYGDALQFARYVALVMRLGARVIVAVPKALSTLMATLPGRPQIVVEGDPIPPHDYCCSLMSLPHVFCTTPESTPAEIPYLYANAVTAKVWGGRLGVPSRPRVGLVWSGRRYPPINYPRDMTLDMLRPVLEVAADFVCLQTDLTDQERTQLAAIPNVIRYGDQFKDFADTAALIENLDLVIAVDTAVAHLAGALGKPVWVMNRYASCWRWMLKRPDSPWYPQLRLFRQSSLGDWSPVVRDVSAAAAGFSAEYERNRRRSSVDPHTLVTLLNAALAHHQGRRFAEAIDAYRHVLTLEARQPEALHYLGVALAQIGDHEGALEPLSLALQLIPNNTALHNHHGNALAGLGRHAEALASYEHASSLDPNFAEAHFNRGVALTALEKVELALDSYQRAIALDPTHARAHNNLGNAFFHLDRHAEALGCYERATQVRADFVDAWVNCANTLRRLGRCEESCAAARTALELDPGCAEAHSAFGAAAAGMGRHAEALSSYQQALQLKPALAEAVWNKSLLELSQGRFREGWAGYEARWLVKSLRLGQRYTTPPWLGGESLRDRVILLHAEQGYGDSIQFCRYAPLVAARGAKVLLGMPSGLRALMASLEGVDSVVTQAPVPGFDFQCPLLSLPLALGTELATIPANVPYLHADRIARESWAARLGPRTAPRVGFAWAGSPTHSNDANRSIALERLLPLRRFDVQCVSLQKEIRATDLPFLAGPAALCRLGEELTDFAATAALLSELDLVITVDTSIAHLAGALGRPVWILLPYVADWRWLREREDSPWYPTARLFRQTAPGDWGGVIERVAGELSTFARQWSGEALAAHPTNQMPRNAQVSPYFAR
jgi:tetratricopeptide (TPR) repeat protein